MNSNDYVTWATGEGANLPDSPAAYAALAIRQLGAQTGIADSKSFNNAMRQASVVATMIAQFTADRGPSNVADDGNVTTLESQFIAALASVVAQYAPDLIFLGTDSGTNDAVHVQDGQPAFSAYATNQLFCVRIGYSNLTTTPTFQWGSLSALTIVRADGTPCQPNDLRAGTETLLAKVGSTVQIVGLRADFIAASTGIPFFSSATFTVPPGITRIKRVRVWGAGGGAAGGASGNVKTPGGGGGGYAEKFQVPVNPGDSITVIVGAGGAGGGAGVSGLAGGGSSFGAVAAVTAGGGGGGTATAYGAGGTYGVVADIGINGTHGTNGFPFAGEVGGGIGGVAAFGAGAAPRTFSSGTGGSDGSDGFFPGGGGNGAATGTTTAQNGGSGAGGLVIIEF